MAAAPCVPWPQRCVTVGLALRQVVTAAGMRNAMRSHLWLYMVWRVARSRQRCKRAAERRGTRAYKQYSSTRWQGVQHSASLLAQGPRHIRHHAQPPLDLGLVVQRALTLYGHHNAQQVNAARHHRMPPARDAASQAPRAARRGRPQARASAPGMELRVGDAQAREDLVHKQAELRHSGA